MSRTGHRQQPVDAEVLNFGERVKELRDAAGLTQAKLAEKANLNLSVVGHIENGKREVGISKVRQLAEALGVQPGDLFTATNEPGDDEPR